ncbi:MAG: hypothetical protein KJ687_10245 [Proteobacteria bacterium]|nr:hypothetical protein [Pseudomonadota bacterium]
MATQVFKRKLTAILSIDVKGYSRLMGEDDEATVRTITAYREIITDKNRSVKWIYCEPFTRVSI